MTSSSPRREALELVHHHPGRLRVRARAFEKGPAGDEVVTRVRQRLDGMTGVLNAAFTRSTGSVLVLYEPGIVEPDEIVAEIADAADLDLPGPETRDPRRPALIAIGVAEELDAAVQELSGRRVDLASLVPAALAGLAAFSWFRHPETRLPRWDNLAYWSFNVFTLLNRREIDARAAARASAEAGRAGAEEEAP
jgi:hypothetical protein